MSIFEIIMLICFGAAWPLSIYKSYTSRSTEGKSVSFLIVILIGYVAGILHKIFNLIYFRNSRIDGTSAHRYTPKISHHAVSAK